MPIFNSRKIYLFNIIHVIVLVAFQAVIENCCFRILHVMLLLVYPLMLCRDHSLESLVTLAAVLIDVSQPVEVARSVSF